MAQRLPCDPDMAFAASKSIPNDDVNPEIVLYTSSY